jgi:hypothetical protein
MKASFNVHVTTFYLQELDFLRACEHDTQVFENRSNYPHTQGCESRQVLQDLEGNQIAPMFQQTFHNGSP